MLKSLLRIILNKDNNINKMFFKMSLLFFFQKKVSTIIIIIDKLKKQALH